MGHGSETLKPKPVQVAPSCCALLDLQLTRLEGGVAATCQCIFCIQTHI